MNNNFHSFKSAWFLKIAFVREVGVCVAVPQAINNHSHEMKPE